MNEDTSAASSPAPKRRRRRANSAKSKAMRRLTEAADARGCTFCNRRFETLFALERHLAAAHKTVMVLRKIDGAAR
jgi:hypothetical protein